MQDINAEIAAAFLAGKSRKIKNTETDGKTVRLHGRVIADRAHPRVIRISLGGIAGTKTTVARLNAILNQSNSGMMLNGTHCPLLRKQHNGKGIYMNNHATFHAVMLPEPEL